MSPRPVPRGFVLGVLVGVLGTLLLLELGQDAITLGMERLATLARPRDSHHVVLGRRPVLRTAGRPIDYPGGAAESAASPVARDGSAVDGASGAQPPPHGHQDDSMQQLVAVTSSSAAAPSGLQLKSRARYDDAAPIPAASLSAVYTSIGTGRLRAVREVLRRFRHFYPDAPVYMYNDGGSPELAQVVAPFNVTYSYNEHLSDIGHSVFFREAAAMSAFVQARARPEVQLPGSCCAVLRRFIDGATNPDVDWVLMLEDDVIIHKPITFGAVHFDLAGPAPYHSLPDGMVQAVAQVLGHMPAEQRYTGAGGCLLGGSFLHELGQHDWRGWVQRLRNATLEPGQPPSALGPDQVLTALFLMNGGTVGTWLGYAETWNDDAEERLAAGTVEVMHQDKRYYGD